MNDQTNSVVEAAASTAAATATKFSYGYVVGGGLIGIAGKIDWAVVISILIGVATYLTNLYFKRRDEKRADEIHELRKKQYEETKNRLKGDIDVERTD
ncbi:MULTISPECIES: phage holin [Acinetobacter calcoaceticus/baumannii complex]|uniref:phage holin n=1 Tax=Acinetobacter calcoaceticus/baumannii complex TaxID=909768 RepID=UPI00059B4FC1|nr:MULTISPECIES: phage holin [Acinetobacter calcoaceticus/baumannii complex]EHU2654888.1 lysis protein [Acinetobacter baumannii]EHU2723834.1 lysis protein [Acinetobacter baumannii]EHU2841941.1 lysis protein [Acinetobacter baumannii]EHU3381560.1 lysis protein [Acinetobacter baumannii]EHU3394181.1 lysis protein [Acinetobacter baumannii]